MRRNIHQKPRIGQLEQGAIFNCCVAEEYGGRDVYGIIITPRCDISNEKVTTFHYLPIVKYKDWLRVNFWEILRKIIVKNLKENIATLLKNKNISPRLIDSFKIEKITNQYSQQFKGKELDRFLEAGKDLQKLENTPIKNPSEDDFLYFFTKYEKISKSLLEEIKKNHRNDFYLIETFFDSDDSDYFVILSREVKRITFDIGIKISKGMKSSELSSLDYIKSDLSQANGGEFISVFSVLGSPVLEHLIQHFNQNFARIGVDDHPQNLVESLFNNC